MKGYRLGYHNQDFVFNASFQVCNTDTGFVFQIGKSGDSFYPVVSFSGYSGYIFDQSGSFVHGYRKNELINISGNYFYGDTFVSGNPLVDETGIARLSYFINDNLIANNISGQTGFFDTVTFEDYGCDALFSLEYVLETGSPCVLADNTGTYLLSSEGYYLAASDCN